MNEPRKKFTSPVAQPPNMEDSPLSLGRLLPDTSDGVRPDKRIRMPAACPSKGASKTDAMADA